MERMETVDRLVELSYILKFAVEEDLSYEVCLNQLRSLWTAYCLHHDLTPDTSKYDADIALIWGVISENDTSPWNGDEGTHDFNLFDLSMGAYLS